ncbi:MAG: cupredoxin family copper-binding protein [Chloroflexia bacterium]|jgi:plastocyanin|nr:cupredoxin family copper-binding protein [Chloroflexia bacterium]
MSRSVWRLLLTVMAGFAMIGAVMTGSAQDTAPLAHPTHIHEGTCEELDPNPAYPLTDVASVAPDAPVGAVEVSDTTVDVTIDDLLASPHAINAHESAENAATYIACGNIEGAVVDDRLIIGLGEQNDSGYAGVAVLSGFDDGYGGAGTDVTVYLAPGLSGEALAASPVAEEDAAASEVAVPIVDFVFDPEVLEITVGTTVTWTNEDAPPHTATSTDDVWDSNILNQGDSYSFTFEEAGTYDYICSIHPSMTAQIIVTDP